MSIKRVYDKIRVNRTDQHVFIRRIYGKETISGY